MSNKTILPGQTIGIIGGGQLGRMMALSARAMGYRIAVLDPVEDSPCGQVADYKVVGDYDDLDAIRNLAAVSDVITYEFENIDAEALEWLCNQAYVPQGKSLLEVTQDRVKEKAAIENAGVQVAPYAVINSLNDLNENCERLGYPVVLKTARGGYDGKGQFVLKGPEDIEEAQALLVNGQCILEKWITFTKEISVIIVRNSNGETAVFPVGENIHRDNILHQTIAPARISKQAENKAIQSAIQLANAFELVGTLAVEMFLTAGDIIYINELAPRPHNSGHYTIEACETSQFEQHIRAVCNLPLGKTELLKPAVMVNILGEHVQNVLENITNVTDWKVHLYGKKDPKVKRKMGHVTILCDSLESVIEEVEKTLIWEEKSLEAKR
ncbi:5-(carboxyamino)imidazole ribonucleotide synthase [Bacillus sp. EB106-08-02-XG196]|uniref:5-(carboxyamino)imidazole ribonucleotide synthase n=1 Tax=Bacillus sp. EB106-08-02-XG196 TaxID=2737049 RepID=UPI0015C4A483|nr:5-(carboxyamino)imidazole ribonucleotide synthase [Bacillus sp. EB106-08-02-XG196]NWQ42256.1 5-(carboxyamino)imidazole ribonucleotide synthase [Bacillus sp. EB106-08-02-XG196]